MKLFLTNFVNEIDKEVRYNNTNLTYQNTRNLARNMALDQEKQVTIDQDQQDRNIQ